MSKKVVITGIGIATPLGCSTARVWTRLLNGESGISKLTSSEYADIPSKVAGFVPVGKSDNEFNAKMYMSSSTTKSTALALQCAETALRDANLENMSLNCKFNTGVSVGLGMVDLQYIEETVDNLNKKGYRRVSPYFVPKILPNMAAGNISIKYGFKGPSICTSTACTSGLHSIGNAFRMITYGDSEVMVAGATEACICPLSVAGFARARALSTKFNDEPTAASRPFDRERDGFVIAEGAGILILENEEHAKNRNAKIYGQVLGYGMSSDAEHITSPPHDGEGAYNCMKKAITDANINKSLIQYINAHGTSTPTGDIAEVLAIKRLFGDHAYDLKVSSTKGAIGHLLGAAGAVETAFTVLSCFYGYIPPTINLQSTENEMNLDFVANKCVQWNDKKRIALTNSFGFGGTNASLCISNM